MTMNHDAGLDAATRILATGKAIAADRFPNMNGPAGQAHLAAWAATITEHGSTFPVEVWEPAVRNWAAKVAGDRMALPRDILREASAIRTVWYGDPDRRAELDRRRNARMSDREARGVLPAGTTPESPADARAAAIAAANSPARRAMVDRITKKLESVFHDPDATPRDRSLARIELEKRQRALAAREEKRENNLRQIGGAA
ncbi:hypothetical protein ACTXK0_01410 [Corynebacterium variabile]|uniref:hypothetical protein n=1 Tax=Corynebacterium variabile TaxID=1727 RepID=UPI003FD4B127